MLGWKRKRRYDRIFHTQPTTGGRATACGIHLLDLTTDKDIKRKQEFEVFDATRVRSYEFTTESEKLCIEEVVRKHIALRNN